MAIAVECEDLLKAKGYSGTVSTLLEQIERDLIEIQASAKLLESLKDET